MLAVATAIVVAAVASLNWRVVRSATVSAIGADGVSSVLGSRPAPSQRPTPSPGRLVRDPVGTPVSMRIMRGDTAVVSTMEFGPRQPGDVFASRCGFLAWWDADESWPKPGAESSRIALVTGHVVCDGTWYPLRALQPGWFGAGGHKGDTAYITYDSGDVVVAEAIDDSKVIEKDALNDTDGYVCVRSRTAGEAWPCDDSARGRLIRVSTCDQTGVLGPDGRAVNNAVERFAVVDVTRP